MTLQLYLLRQLLVSIGFALAGLGFLVLPAITVQAVHKLEGAGLGAVLEYVPLVLIELFPYLVPIAFLLGIVATFGRLAADNEWTAIQMAGIGPLRMLLPGLALASVGMVGTYLVLATIAPEWKYQQRAYLRDSQLEKVAGLGLGRTQFSIGEMFVDAMSTDGAGSFSEVILGIPPEMLGTGGEGGEGGEEGERAPEDGAGAEGDLIVVIADEVQVRIEDGLLKMFFANMRSLRENQELANEYPYLIQPLAELISQKEKSRSEPKYMTTALMARRLTGEYEPGEELLTAKKRAEYRYEIHRRLALAASYAVFLLLGAATGLWLRSGTQLGAMTGAIGFAFVYYMLSLELGKELAQLGLIAPEVAAWATNAIFLVLGAALARRVLWR